MARHGNLGVSDSDNHFIEQSLEDMVIDE